MAYNPLLKPVPDFDMVIGFNSAEYRHQGTGVAVEVASQGKLLPFYEWRVIIKGAALLARDLNDPHLSCGYECEFNLGLSVPPRLVSEAMDVLCVLDYELMGYWPRYGSAPQPLDLAAV